MIAFNSQNFKVGPCAVIYKEEVLGITKESSNINFNSIYHDATCARAYKQSLAKRLLSMTLTFTTEVMAVDKSMGMFLDENECLTLDALGEKAEGGELLLIPVSPADSTGYRFPNALLIYNGTFSFHENREHRFKLQFEASFDEREVLFERVPIDEGMRVYLENPVAIEPAAFERAMTAYIAGKMNMTVDTDIFRGGIPINIDGCGVALVNQELQNIATNQRYEICVSYINHSRDNVMQVIHDLTEQFPLYGEEVNVNGGAIAMKAILKGSLEFSRQIDDDGKIKNFGELSLVVII